MSVCFSVCVCVCCYTSYPFTIVLRTYLCVRRYVHTVAYLKIGIGPTVGLQSSFEWLKLCFQWISTFRGAQASFCANVSSSLDYFLFPKLKLELKGVIGDICIFSIFFYTFVQVLIIGSRAPSVYKMLMAIFAWQLYALLVGTSTIVDESVILP